MMCPFCKEEKKFIRVVEVHEEIRMLENPIIGVPGPPPHLKTTEHPTAYCESCKAVIFIGPSADEVKEDFKKRESEREEQAKKYERHWVSFPWEIRENEVERKI